jgi:transposase InsO family protein
VGHRITRDRSQPTRGKGCEYLHVCVDDAFRLAHTELPPGERQESAANFLVRALAWFVSLGVTSQRVMTENGSAFKRRAFRMDCAEARLKHERTRPCMPRTNGKAERFISEQLARASLFPIFRQLGRAGCRHSARAPRLQQHAATHSACRQAYALQAVQRQPF